MTDSGLRAGDTSRCEASRYVEPKNTRKNAPGAPTGGTRPLRPIARLNPVGAFDSAWRKWDWGGKHAQELKNCFPGGASTRPFVDTTVESTYEPESQCIILTIGGLAPFPDEWSLRLGDVVGNYRSALDHLAWAVVMQGTRGDSLKAAEARRIYFPVVEREGDFTDRTKTLLGARSEDLAIFRSYQPFAGEDPDPNHCMVILNVCSNLDKHKALQPMPIAVSQSELTVNHLEDCEISGDKFSVVRSDPLKPNAEIGRIPVNPTGPHPRAFMNGRFGLDITIDHRVRLRSWLNETHRFIGSLLAEFSDPPKGVLYFPPDAFE